jgi:hypothetical protein
MSEAKHILMTQEELEAKMDAFFEKEFAFLRPDRPSQSEPATQGDSLEAIVRDFPHIFGGPSGTA